MSQFGMPIDLPGGGQDPSREWQWNEDVEQGLLSLAPKVDSKTEDTENVTGSKPEEPNGSPGPTDSPTDSPPYPFPKAIFDTCEICLKSKHNPWYCPYKKLVPKGERVGDGCEIVCRICGCVFSKGRCCDLDEGRAIVKKCFVCWKSGHWSDTCPQVDRCNEVENPFKPIVDYWDLIDGTS